MAEAFSGLIQARCQPGFAALIERAAQARGMSHSEWVRQAARMALELDGFDPASLPSRSASALYDSLNGSQRYALVDGDRIISISYHAELPSEGDWRPVQHEDSETFDDLKHWRLAPSYTIEADRVVCTYPVIAKAPEHA
jgi:hypothetical protein